MEGSDSSITGATVATHVYTEFTPYNARLLLTFVALSLFAHLLLLMWPNPLTVPALIAKQQYPPLQIQLETAQSRQITQKHKTKTRRKVTHTPPPASHKPQTRVMPKSAEEVIEEAYRAVPGIMKQIESENAISKPSTIFDPTLRAQLEQARRKQVDYEAMLRAIAKHPEIEVLTKTDDYLKLRIHGQCWQVPLSKGYDPFDVRIMAVDTNCPKPKSKLFDKQSAPVRNLKK